MGPMEQKLCAQIYACRKVDAVLSEDTDVLAYAHLSVFNKS